MLKYLRYALWGVVALALVAALAWFQVESARRGTPAGFVITPYTMTNQQGRAVTDKTFSGKPSAYFFGFTYCPEICPTTLAYMTTMLKELGPDADRLNVVFVSVDPERDTPAHLREYLQSFDPRIMGLTGTDAQVKHMAKAFNVYYKKIETPGIEYTMDHTASILLFDAQGRFSGTIDFHEKRDVGLEKLRLLLKKA